MTRGNQEGRPSKVAQLIEEYDLQDLGAELERLWTLENPSERRSLRDLADQFNRRLLRETVSAESMDPIGEEVENTYRLLTDEDANTGDRTRMERRLERNGVDVDELRKDFVTYQSVRTYLKNHRGAEYTGNDASDRREHIEESIQRLQSRTATVAESKVSQLQRSEELSLNEEFRTTAVVQIICEACGSQFTFQELLDRGGCDCE